MADHQVLNLLEQEKLEMVWWVMLGQILMEFDDYEQL